MKLFISIVSALVLGFVGAMMLMACKCKKAVTSDPRTVKRDISDMVETSNGFWEQKCGEC